MIYFEWKVICYDLKEYIVFIMVEDMIIRNSYNIKDILRLTLQILKTLEKL